MQVILRDDMDNLGKSGEVVNVKEGYARNFLLPRGHAIKATETDVARVEHEKRVIAARTAKLAKEAQAEADNLSQVSVSIARAVYFGAKVLILDEPTSALGVKQSGIVLKYVIQARARGRGVIFITHNPHHAFPVGDRFVLLKRGRMMGSYLKSETSLEQLTSLMAGGAELEQLSHELQGLAADPEMAEVAKELAAEVKETA